MKIMEKNIKDYLHFYIGCEFSNGLDAKVRTVTFSNADTILGAKVGDFKLILRPLSDMTEEEMKELYLLVFGKKFVGDNISHRDGLTKNDRWVLWSGIERLFIYKDGDVGADCDLHYMRVPYQKVFTWQLSKGFDLFGLIDAGLVIKKLTEINQ